jgi:RecJ-like exonuclease
MRLWHCPEHGIYGGQIICPQCGGSGEAVTIAICGASADTQPEAGDVQQAPLVSGAVDAEGSETPND